MPLTRLLLRRVPCWPFVCLSLALVPCKYGLLSWHCPSPSPSSRRWCGSHFWRLWVCVAAFADRGAAGHAAPRHGSDHRRGLRGVGNSCARVRRASAPTCPTLSMRARCDAVPPASVHPLHRHRGATGGPRSASNGLSAMPPLHGNVDYVCLGMMCARLRVAIARVVWFFFLPFKNENEGCKWVSLLGLFPNRRKRKKKKITSIAALVYHPKGGGWGGKKVG